MPDVKTLEIMSAEASRKATDPYKGSLAQEPANDNDETNPKDRLGLKKPPLRLVPAALQLYVAKVFGLGARKYGAYNWRQKKVRLTVYTEAAMRHLLAINDGELLDPESGQPHAAHVAACMGIILDAAATGNLIDDRPTPGAAARLIEELTEKDAPQEPARVGGTVTVEPNPLDYWNRPQYMR